MFFFSRKGILFWLAWFGVLNGDSVNEWMLSFFFRRTLTPTSPLFLTFASPSCSKILYRWFKIQIFAEKFSSTCQHHYHQLQDFGWGQASPSQRLRMGFVKMWQKKKKYSKRLDEKSRWNFISYHQVADLAPLMRTNPGLEAWPKLLFSNQSEDKRLFLYLNDLGVEAGRAVTWKYLCNCCYSRYLSRSLEFPQGLAETC